MVDVSEMLKSVLVFIDKIDNYSGVLMLLVTTIYAIFTYLVVKANRASVKEMEKSRASLYMPNMVLDMSGHYLMEGDMISDKASYDVLIRNSGGGNAYDVSVSIDIKKDTTGIVDYRSNIDECNYLSSIGSHFPSGVSREYSIIVGLEEYNGMERRNQPPQKYLELEFTMRYKYRTLSNVEQSETRTFVYNTAAIQKDLPYHDTGGFRQTFISEIKNNGNLLKI